MIDLPPIQDEASDTPLWVPFFGMLLLVLAGVLYLVELQIRDHLASAPSSASPHTNEQASNDEPQRPVGEHETP